MDDDFNSAGALASLFDLVKAINEARTAGLDELSLSGAQSALRELADVLGLRLQIEEFKTEAEPFIDLLVEIREKLRAAKQFELADQIRSSLAELGIAIEDSKGGTTWRAG
jgi:cysteinyl-tRNA synthetase